MNYYCPQCYRKYDGDQYDTCPEDGARLYELSDKRDDPLLGTVVDDRFRVEAILGEGGMGAVYKATQLSVQREVALKILRPELDNEELFVERFFREARVIAELSHPNIVRLIEFGQDRQSKLLFLVMELVKGTDMAGLLEAGRLRMAMALDVVYQVCAGLTEPHSQGIIHRDLKPDNIVLLPISDGTFQVKLLDFGIARTDDTGTRLTQTGMICGTPAYMSPEQAQNNEVIAQSDLYSLGVVLFEMLTGHLPFEAASGLQLLMGHVQQPPPKLTLSYPGAFPEQISSLVSDLLEKNPDDRPHSARAVQRRVQKIRRELDLPPVRLSDEDSAQLNSGQGQDALFTPWILPSLDPDKPQSVPPSSLDASDVVDEHSDTLPFGKKVAAEAGATQLAYAQNMADDSTEESETPSQREFSPAISEQSNQRKPLIMLGMVAAVIIIVALVLTIFNLTSGETDTDRGDPGDSDISSVVAVDESDSIDEPERLADGTDDSADGPPESDDQDTKPVQDEGTPSEEGPEVAALDPAPASDSANSIEPEGAVYDGLLHIRNAAEAEAAQSYREATRGLLVQIYSGPPVELPNLQIVGGPIQISKHDGINSLSLPALERIDGALRLEGLDQAFELNIPNLHTIGEGLHLLSTEFSSLDLGEIRHIGGTLNVQQNGELESISMPRLESLGGLFLTYNESLQRIRLAALRDVGENLIINNNRSLHELTLNNLESAAEVRITDNGRLSNCTVEAIIDGLEASGWRGDSRTSNNGDDRC